MSEELKPIANLLALLSFQTARLIQLEESRISIGTKAVSRTVTTETVEVALDPPWISFSINNDSGANALYYAVNKEEDLMDATRLPAGGSSQVRFDYPLIYTIYLKAVSGSVAARLFGVEGRKQSWLM